MAATNASRVCLDSETQLAASLLSRLILFAFVRLAHSLALPLHGFLAFFHFDRAHLACVSKTFALALVGFGGGADDGGEGGEGDGGGEGGEGDGGGGEGDGGGGDGEGGGGEGGGGLGEGGDGGLGECGGGGLGDGGGGGGGGGEGLGGGGISGNGADYTVKAWVKGTPLH